MKTASNKPKNKSKPTTHPKGKTKPKQTTHPKGKTKPPKHTTHPRSGPGRTKRGG